jgi:hypothetical protein
MYNSNGPQRGANVTADQSSYDIIYKDVIINSNLVTPSNNTWVYTLQNNNFNNVYKAEIISAALVFDSSNGIPTNVKNQSIILSIQQLNGTTVSIPGNSSTQGSIFCQIPDNSTPLGLRSDIINLYITCSKYESIQYYNPPVSKVNQLNIQWYDTLGNIIQSTLWKSFYFTIRIYYLQKRNNTTSISVPILNFAGDATGKSLFQPINY